MLGTPGPGLQVGDGDEEGRVKEQLFLIMLVDECPRCGWEVERGMKREEVAEHLAGCTDKKAIAAHQKKVKEEAARAASRVRDQESQEDVMAFKTWEHNGRQVGWARWSITVVPRWASCGCSARRPSGGSAGSWGWRWRAPSTC